MPHEAAYPVLGVPLRIRTNDSRIQDLCARLFGYWREIDNAVIDPVHTATLDLVVESEATAPPLAGRIRYRYHEGTVLGSGPGILLHADRRTGRGLGFIHPHALNDALLLRRYVIEFSALLLTTRHDRAPIHAAAVAANGTVLLLAGPSGGGKSTLLYGLQRAGVPIVAEESACIACADTLRVWGHVSGIGLSPEAVQHFPELSGLSTRQMPNGRTKVFVDLAGTAGDRRPGTATGKFILCILERYGSPLPLLQPLSREAAAKILMRTREPGLEHYGDTAHAVDALVREAECHQLSTAMPVARCVDALRALLQD